MDIPATRAWAYRQELQYRESYMLWYDTDRQMDLRIERYTCYAACGLRVNLIHLGFTRQIYRGICV